MKKKMFVEIIFELDKIRTKKTRPIQTGFKTVEEEKYLIQFLTF